jgi:hypothetical protein
MDWAQLAQDSAREWAFVLTAMNPEFHNLWPIYLPFSQHRRLTRPPDFGVDTWKYVLQ